MTMTTLNSVAAAEAARAPHWGEAESVGRVGLAELLFSDDYRLIALKGIAAALMMAAVAGVFALTFRAELAYPDLQFLSARPYIGLVTVHGMLMVFGFVIPLVIFVAYYMLPAHFHAMFLGFCVQTAVAGVYYLFPYFTGRRYHEGLANLHFWLWQFGIFGQIMLMFALGVTSFPRWVVDYLPLTEWATSQLWLTVAGFVVGIGFLLFAVNLAWSARAGEAVAGDPWAGAEEGPMPAAAPAE